MSRTVSANMHSEIYGQNITQKFLTLITLSYGATTPIRIVNDYEDITSNGNVFTAWAFKFTMPQDTDGRRSAHIEMDNIDRSLAIFILDAGITEIAVTEQLIRSSTPDTIEMTRSYIMKNITITRKVISGELVYQQNLQDSFPKLTKTPSKFPGVF